MVPSPAMGAYLIPSIMQKACGTCTRRPMTPVVRMHVLCFGGGMCVQERERETQRLCVRVLARECTPAYVRGCICVHVHGCLCLRVIELHVLHICKLAYACAGALVPHARHSCKQDLGSQYLQTEMPRPMTAPTLARCHRHPTLLPVTDNPHTCMQASTACLCCGTRRRAPS